MRSFFLFLSLVLALPLTAFSAGAEPEQAAAPWQGIVLEVRDGDSVLVLPFRKNNKKRKPATVRLYGVDAPELGQTFGPDAHQWLADRLPRGTRVEVIPYDRDQYGRVVGVVRHRNEDVNAAMVAEGLAWVYWRYCKQAFCRDWKAAEKLARSQKKGLWQDNKPLQPERWRRQNPR